MGERFIATFKSSGPFSNSTFHSSYGSRSNTTISISHFVGSWRKCSRLFCFLSLVLFMLNIALFLEALSWRDWLHQQQYLHREQDSGSLKSRNEVLINEQYQEVIEKSTEKQPIIETPAVKKELPSQKFSEIIEAAECEGISYAKFRHREDRERVQKNLKDLLSEKEILKRSNDCQVYFEVMDVISAMGRPQTLTEREYPIAYAHLIGGGVGLLELYFAMHFRPLDSHCIHVDPKANPEVKAAVDNIIKCYKTKWPDTTLFVAENPTPVLWQDSSVLEADLICLRQLLERNSHWKIFLNLASSELPLMIPDELRRKLKYANGSIIDVGPNTNSDRQSSMMSVQRGYGHELYGLQRQWLGYLAVKPPCGITIMKGYKNVAITREMSDFTINHKAAMSFYAWLKNTECPDEHLYSTLSTLSVIEDGRPGDPYHMVLQQTLHDHSPNSGQLCHRRYRWAGGWNQKKSEAVKGAEEDRTVYYEKCFLREDTCQDLSWIQNPPDPPESNSNSWLGKSWTSGVCLRESLWHYEDCQGRLVRRMCNFGIGDLPLVRDSGCLFGNKFNVDVDSMAPFCQLKYLRETETRAKSAPRIFRKNHFEK